eukprot:1981313-Rhodomonas_salina.2
MMVLRYAMVVLVVLKEAMVVVMMVLTHAMVVIMVLRYAMVALVVPGGGGRVRGGTYSLCHTYPIPSMSSTHISPYAVLGVFTYA